MITDPFYVFDLMDILNGKASYDEEENFLHTYIYPQKEELFPYVKNAADKGYAEAYESLGDRYAKGNGCPEDWEKAFYYWNLSIKNDCFGYAKIGDCYRLGKGTEKNYDKAWEAYENALGKPDEFQIMEGPPVEELLLQKFNGPRTIETEWLKYASEKAKDVQPWIYREIAYAYFERNPENFLYWIRLAADAGNIEAKCDLFDSIKDSAEQEKLIQEIFDPEQYRRDRYRNASASVIELAKTIIDNKAYEEQAFHLLYKNDFDWLCDHYKQQNREDEFEAMGGEIDEEEDDDSYEEIPEGYFRCSCCKKIISRDDQDDPDAQGNYCNNCYYSGDCLRTVYDDCPGEEE